MNWLARCSATAALLLCAAAPALHADVKLSPVFGDQMVLQRQSPVAVFGTADPREKVTVSFAGQSKTTTADASGQWLVRLDALEASSESRELVATGARTSAKAKDVLVGEVWLAGGQSNMGLPLSAAHNAAEVIPQAGDPLLRLYKVPNKTAVEPQRSVAGKWETSTPDTAKNFSAVAYFFARDLRKALNCPVGVIAAPWGGTPIETWISLEGLKQNPPAAKTLEKWNKALEQYQQIQANPKLVEEYNEQLKKWKKEVEPAYNAAVKAWMADKTAGKQVGPKPTPASPEPQNPDPMGIPSPSRRPSTPTISYNAMISPLAPYSLRGVLWYQGEANGSAGLEYRDLLPRLITSWRQAWNSELHFLIVQLPSNGPDPIPVADRGWPWLREAQHMAMKLPKTSLAVTLDLGDPNDVHPHNKLDVGHRLALLARRDVYNEKLVASGPFYESHSVEGQSIHVRFKDAGSGLTIGQAPWRAPGVEPLPTDKLLGFFVAGEDRQWVQADARIEGSSVMVSSAQVAKPVAVRYGWANSPRCNLYNREGLPAAPFRTDDWPSK